jgi:hypothetical protein
MTPTHAKRLAKYGHKIEGGLPVLDFNKAKYIGKALGIEGVHNVRGGYHPGKNEYELVEALNRYNQRNTKWEQKFGRNTGIAEPDNSNSHRN